MEYITLISGILEELLSIASTATSGQTQNIIGIIEKIIPVAVSTATGLLQPLQNIIASLSSNGAVTADQLTTLQAQGAAIDAALDAAAAADGLS